MANGSDVEVCELYVKKNHKYFGVCVIYERIKQLQDLNRIYQRQQHP